MLKKTTGTSTREITDIMRNDYCEYAFFVIEERALTKIDGSKTAGRRILWAMDQMGLASNKPHRKVSNIVGETMGNYHPHGDAAISQTLVRLAQPWTMMVPLIDPQGNFGSADGDSAAAARYIEARLSKAGEMLLEDTKEICPFVPNYDDRLTEPTFLGGPFPNILINGDQGLAVGMSSKTPSHNPTEVARLVQLLAKTPNAKLSQIMEIIPGPDFPTGGKVLDEGGVKSYFETGRGQFTISAVGTIDKSSNKHVITVKELPYQVGTSQIVMEIANLIENGKIEGIYDVKDYTDGKNGTRLVIETKPDINATELLQELYQKTSLRTTFSVNMNILDEDGQPVLIGFVDLAKKFVEHRRRMVTAKIQYQIAKNLQRLHILEVYLAAIKNMAKVIKIIQDSEDIPQARTELSRLLKFPEEDMDIILDMPLRRLSKLEHNKISNEHSRLKKENEDLESTLGSSVKINNIICKEMDRVIEVCGCDRKSQIKSS